MAEVFPFLLNCHVLPFPFLFLTLNINDKIGIISITNSGKMNTALCNQHYASHAQKQFCLHMASAPSKLYETHAGMSSCNTEGVMIGIM
jgi:hypothetical protein